VSKPAQSLSFNIIYFFFFYSFSVHPGNTLLWYPTGALRVVVSFSLQLIELPNTDHTHVQL
jgi:hypothetical protein